MSPRCGSANTTLNNFNSIYLVVNMWIKSAWADLKLCDYRYALAKDVKDEDRHT